MGRDITLDTVARRFLLWLAVCAVSAAPSFVWAYQEYDRGAMVLGVLLFAMGYTAATCTERFERFHRRPFVRRTLYIDYITRMAVSVLYPVGMAADLIPGLFSIGLVRGLGLEPESFLGTLATTVVQGTVLNAILSVFMLIVYGFQRLFLPPPEERRPRGFEVVMAPVAPLPVPPLEE